MKINNEGLTWSEWFAATMYNESDFTFGQLKVLKIAWQEGYDPSEYRAAGLNKNKYFSKSQI